jgi:hypothetical protein
MMVALGAWQGVAMDSLKFYPGPPCQTLLRPAGGPPQKRLYCNFRGGPPTGWLVYGCLLSLWTPHAARLRWCHDAASTHSCPKRLHFGPKSIHKIQIHSHLTNCSCPAGVVSRHGHQADLGMAIREAKSVSGGDLGKTLKFSSKFD